MVLPPHPATRLYPPSRLRSLAVPVLVPVLPARLTPVTWGVLMEEMGGWFPACLSFREAEVCLVACGHPASTAQSEEQTVDGGAPGAGVGQAQEARKGPGGSRTRGEWCQQEGSPPGTGSVGAAVPGVPQEVVMGRGWAPGRAWPPVPGPGLVLPGWGAEGAAAAGLLASSPAPCSLRDTTPGAARGRWGVGGCCAQGLPSAACAGTLPATPRGCPYPDRWVCGGV